MKRLTILIILLLINNLIFAQKIPQWGLLSKGKYTVGYSDTVVFNKNQQYNFKDYSGSKPYFIKVWYPSKEKTKVRLLYYDYLKILKTKKISNQLEYLGIKVLADTIQTMQIASFQQFGLQNNLDTDDPIKIKTAEMESIFHQKVYATENIKSLAEKLPTVIYHHGNGGSSIENNVLFEYLASNGFVVISAYYHWPNQETHTYPTAYQDVQFVVDFAKSLSFVDKENLSYIGHSWGGGIALNLNQKQLIPVKRYIIYDSSIEHYIPDEMKMLRPNLDSLLRNHADDFVTPTTVISARYSYFEAEKRVINPFPEYIPFQNLNQEVFDYLTLKEPLNHEAFTSLGLIRNTVVKKSFQSDKSTLMSQYKNYLYLVELTKNILKDKSLIEDGYYKYKFKKKEK